MRAVLIPVDEPPREIELPEGESHLRALQEHVGGDIEAIDVGRDDATSYGNEEAKCTEPTMDPNAIGTALVFPDAGEWLMNRVEAQRHPNVIVVDTGDVREPFIAGPLVVCGFDPSDGEDRPIPNDLAASLLSGASDG